MVDVEAVRARAAAATEGPWEHEDGPGTDLHFGTMRYQTIRNAEGQGFIAVATSDHASFEFIAHARSDVPALCDEVERLREALRRVVEAAEANGPWQIGVSPGQTAMRDALDAARALLSTEARS